MGLAAKLARSELSLSQQRWFFSEQAGGLVGHFPLDFHPPTQLSQLSSWLCRTMLDSVQVEPWPILLLRKSFEVLPMFIPSDFLSSDQLVP